MKIEFAVLLDNRTWDTVIEEVPFTEEDTLEDIEAWARTELLSQVRFRKAVLITIYNDSPEDEDVHAG